MTLTRVPHRLVVTLCALTTAALAWTARAAGPDEKPTINSVAPAGSFLVASVDDYAKARAALQASPFGSLWSEPAVKDFVKAILEAEDSKGEGGPKWMLKQLEEMGVDKPEVLEPAGAVGLALFTEAPAAPKTKTDQDEHARDTLHLIALCDFGPNAEAAEQAIEKLLAAAEKRGVAKLDEERHEGQTIRVIKRVKPAAKPGENAEDEGDDESSSGPFDTTSFDTFRLTRVGTAMVLGTSKDNINAAIDHLTGHGAADAKTLATDKTMQATLGQHPAGSHAYAAFLFNDSIRALLQRNIGDTAEMMTGESPDVRKLLEAFGLFSVQSVSLALRFENESGAFEQTLGVLAPEKKGLLTLLDTPAERFEPPAFVGADAGSFTTLNVRFDRLIEIARGLFKSLPASMQQTGAAGLASFEAVAGPILASLDTEVDVVAFHTRPLTADSAHSLLAIKLKDPLSLSTQLTTYTAKAGMEARDFQGNQIFDAPPGGAGLPIQLPSLGIGAGYLFVGRGEDIENAMRLAGGAEASRLAASDRFKRAAAAVEPGACINGYDNTRESIEWTYWSMEHEDDVTKAMLDKMGMDDDDVRARLEDIKKNRPDWQKHLPPMDVILRHLGDTIYSIRPTPDGFRGRTLMLPPEAK